MTALQPCRDYEGPPTLLRQKALERAERQFDVMQEIGADLLLACSSVSSQTAGGLDRAAAGLRELGEQARRRGLRIEVVKRQCCAGFGAENVPVGLTAQGRRPEPRGRGVLMPLVPAPRRVDRE